MEYQTVFDVTRNGFPLAIPGFATLLALGIGAFFLFVREEGNEGNRATPRQVLLGIAFTFASLFALIAWAQVSVEYYRVKRALETGNCKIIVGTIENFKPMPRADTPSRVSRSMEFASSTAQGGVQQPLTRSGTVVSFATAFESGSATEMSKFFGWKYKSLSECNLHSLSLRHKRSQLRSRLPS